MRPRVGDRVRVTGVMSDDPAPLPVGLEGTVTGVTPPDWAIQQFDVDWDEQDGCRRSLMLLPGDPFAIIEREAGR